MTRRIALPVALLTNGRNLRAHPTPTRRAPTTLLNRKES